MNIQDIRKQYPQYNDLSDQDLAKALHQKFYSDLPFEDFSGRIGLAPITPPSPVVASPADKLQKMSSILPPSPSEGLIGSFEMFLPGFGETAPSATKATAPSPIPGAPVELTPEEEVVSGIKPEAKPEAPPEDEGFARRNFRYISDALASGFESMRANVKGEVMSVTGAIIQDIERKYGPGAAMAPADVKQRYETAVKEFAQAKKEREDLERAGAEREKVSPLRPETAQLKAAMQSDVGFMESAKEAGQAIVSNPVGVITDLGFQSLPASMYMAAVAMTSYFGTRSPTAAAVGGGTASMVSEFGNEYAERRQKGESHEEAWKNAQIKTGVIGVFDGVSMGMAGKATGEIVAALTKQKPITVAATQLAKEVGRQAGLGAAGEAFGSLAVGEMPNPAQVLAEAVGEAFTAPVEGISTYQKVKVSKEDALIKKLDDKLKDNLGDVGEPPRAASTDEFNTLYTTLKSKLQREPSAEELEEVLDDYERTPGVSVEDVVGRFEPSVPTPVRTEAAGPPTIPSEKAEPGGLGIPSAPSVDVGGRKEPTLGALEEKGKILDLTQKLEAKQDTELEAGILEDERRRGQAALTKEVNTEIQEALDLAKQAIVEDPRSAGFFEEDKTFAEDFAANVVQVYEGLEKGTLPNATRAIENLRTEANNLKQTFQQRIADRETYRKGVEPTAKELEDTGAVFENELEPAKGFFTGDNDVYGVDTEGNTTKLNTPEELAAFHEANKDEAEPDFTAGDAGYYVVPRERTAPEVVPDASTIKENPNAEEVRGYKWARDSFLDGQSDIYHIDPEENVTPVTSLKQLQQLNAEWQGDPDAGFWSVPKEDATGERPGRILKMITEATGPSFDATMATLLKSRKAAFNRLRKLFAEGKINAQQFTQAAIKILDSIDDQKMADFNKSKRLTRGPDIVRQRILEAVRRKKISRETAEFALWLINNNPQVANDLAIKLNLPKDKRAQAVSDGTAGYYDPFSKLVRAVLRRDPDTGKYYDTNPETLVHEILHHTERMLPAPLRKLIRKEWEKQLLRAAKKADASNDRNLKEYMALLMEAYTTGNEAAERLAHSYIIDGTVPKAYYALTNPSEFWAVNGSNILYGRYKADTNFAKVKQWVSEFIEAIKRIFGLNSKSAVIKGLQAVLDGDGTFVSRYILSEGTAKSPMITPAKEAQAMKQMLRPGKLSQPIVDAINNNDISGALRVLASRLTNPLYKDLAEKLASLNLPTTIAFDNARNLTRRQIDKESGPQQNRLFTYIQLNYPSLYNKYFKNYDREENLEQVYEGIKELNSGSYNLNPVIAEFTDVSKSFKDNMRGLDDAGAYYPAFDAITLDFTRATNDIFLHEVLHAATEAILEAPLETLTEGQRAAREELKRIYDYAVANIPLDLYGLTNIHEFVSELFSNKDFQERLKKISYKPTRVPIFTKLVQTIFKIVGIDNLASNAMVQATQLFSAVRTRTPAGAGARFAPKGKRVRGPVSTTWRTAEQVGVKITEEIQNAIKGHAQWGEMLPRISRAMWEAGNTVFRKAILGGANLRQIDDLTKTKFPQISGAIRIIEQMIADRNRTMTKAKDILTNWTRAQAKNPGQSRLMGRIMLEATIRGIDPDTAAAGTLNKPMQDAWDGLNPEFKKIYRQVRDFYADSINTMISEMKKRALQLPKAERQKVIKEINDKFGPDKLVKPYFPLRRFGQYWFQVGKGNFKEFYEFESALAREMAFLKRKAQLEKGNAQQRDLAESMRKGNGISELYNQNVSSTQVLKDAQELVDNVTSNNVADVKKELKESLDQLIYILLPQQSVRKMFINRQSIQGASEDMIRVFATTAVHTAYQQSRFKYAEKFVNNLLNAKEYIKELPNSDVYDDYIKEVEKRTPTILSNEDTSMAAVVAGKLSDATFYFMLSAPFSAMLNILGMAAITMPYIGGRYGYVEANKVLLKNMGRYFATLPKRSISPAFKGQIMQMEFPSIVEGGKLDPLLQRAADRFIEDNDINISQTNDIMDIGGRPSELYTGRYNTVKRAIAALFHQSERLNREVALLSTFELAYNKFLKEPKKDLRGVIQRDANGDPISNTPDEAFELAITEAKDIAGLSLGDFTRQMKPRYFTPPLLSVLTKFKQYSVLATYVVARNFYFTFAAPFRKGEIAEFRKQMEKDGIPANIIEQRISEADAQRVATYKEGRRRLAGILGMTFLLGGAEALPFFTLGIGTLIKMLANDDDDEFFDWENWFKNYMEVELGGYAAELYKKMGMKAETADKAGRKTLEAVARGPASVITGGSLTERVSLDPINLWLRDPRFSTDTRESVVEGVIANAGPVVGLGVNWAEAIELMEKGQYQRAFEKAAPAIVAKPVSAYRMADEGAKTKSGVKLVDDFSAWEIAMQAIGLQPERLAQKQKAAIEAKTYEQKVIDKRNTLMDRLWMERGNTETYASVIENVQKFNQKYPEYVIEPKDLIESFKRRSQAQMEAEVFGAQIQKKLRPRVSPMLEYGRE